MITTGNLRQFTELNWDSTKELFDVLENFFKDLQLDFVNKRCFHKVCTIKSPTQTEMAFERIVSLFNHLEEKSRWVQAKLVIFYIGTEELRYKFTRQEIKGEPTRCFITREERGNIGNEYYARKTCECDITLLLKANIMIQNEGYSYFNIREISIFLPYESVSYRLQTIHEYYETGKYERDPLVMHLMYIDHANPDDIGSNRTGLVHYFDSHIFIDKNVSGDMSYSEWGAWKKINSHKDLS